MSNQALICIPTYNENENLQQIVQEIFENVDVDILVIDDNSPDGTGEIADQISQKDPRVHVLHRAQKEGLGPAYIAGFRWAIQKGYTYIFEMDADFSHQPKYLEGMLDSIQTYDVVVGSRYVEGGGTEDWGLFRSWLSRGGGAYARTILGLKVRDLTAGFVLWRVEVLKAINLDRIEASGYVFQIEMKYQAIKKGFSVKEIPIVFPDREKGISKMTPSIALEAISHVWKVRFKKKD